MIIQLHFASFMKTVACLTPSWVMKSINLAVSCGGAILLSFFLKIPNSEVLQSKVVYFQLKTDRKLTWIQPQKFTNPVLLFRGFLVSLQFVLEWRKFVKIVMIKADDRLMSSFCFQSSWPHSWKYSYFTNLFSSVSIKNAQSTVE